MPPFTSGRWIAEKVFAALWLGIGVAVFILAGNFADGGAMYPRLIAVVMAGLAAVELFSGKHENPPKLKINEEGEEEDGQETSLRTALGFFAIFIGTIWLMTWVGYLIAGSIGSFLFVRFLFGETTVRSVLMTLGIIAFTAGLPLLFGMELPAAALW
ncbi:tripartite tricarboxylate transporter TctB family protein [Pseudochelatococcus sp. B33]